MNTIKLSHQMASRKYRKCKRNKIRKMYREIQQTSEITFFRSFLTFSTLTQKAGRVVVKRSKSGLKMTSKRRNFQN